MEQSKLRKLFDKRTGVTCFYIIFTQATFTADRIN